ncbi:MAG: hypothetical protein Q8M29_13880 [Bacteroidota bacterium]|nr:hypothetical protein [Bacteroidota bacterium]
MENNYSGLKQQLFDHAYHLKEMGSTFDEATIALSKLCDDTALVEEVIKEVRNAYYKAKRSEGMIKIGIGATLILAGFVITCSNFHSNQSFSFAMYGLTTVGIIIVFWGLYKIIG